jgi:putative transposase
MTISFARHQFPPDIIRHAVWLYLRFTLSFRDVEDLPAERGLDVSYETVRRWLLKFGPLFAKETRRRRNRPTSRWHLDEMAVLITCRRFWSGELSTTKARFSICWCNGDATRLQR